MSVDPLADKYPGWNPYNYTLNNPIGNFDADGRSVNNEYEIKKNKDGSTTTTQTGTKGGDETDYITYKDAEGNVTGKETVDVQHTTVEGEIFSEDRGPGYDFKMIGTLSPAIEPTDDPFTSGDVLAIAGLRFLFKKGIKRLGKAAAKEGTVIVGEGMKRVSSVAAKNPGSIILNNMPKFSGTADQITSKMMQYNRKWILQQMRSGRPILDIGLDPTRGVPSIFYQMEKNMMKNYLKLHPGAF